MQGSSSAKKASIALGVFLAVVMVAGVFVPFVQQTLLNNTTTDSTQPTDTVIPTFPPPPSNLDAITFNQVYLHPSGIFAIGQPSGWNASPPNMGSTIAQVDLINNDLLSVVDCYVEAAPITTAQLSDHFSEAVINASWTNFTTWQESNRQMQGDKLVIDFTVTLSGRTYVARQEAWTDGTWIYVVRVLVPENATDLLRYLLDNYVKSFQPLTEFQNTELDWNAYYDPDASHIIRYPSEWTITDSAPGRPTSISSADGGILLRVEARAGTSVADQAAARSYVESTRSGINVVSVTPVTRGLGQGFSVAYSYTTVDGSKDSGLMVLLNGPDNTLHVADLLFQTSGIDLNQVVLSVPSPAATAEATSAATAQATAQATAEATSETGSSAQAYLTLAEVMSTFYVIQPLDLSAQSLPATPTPAYSPTPYVTLTPVSSELNFGAVTAEATAGSTAEPTAPASAPTPAITPAASAEATAAS